MSKFGNPKEPCVYIGQSKELLEVIAKTARDNADTGRADTLNVEAGLTELRSDAAINLGAACTNICGKQQRCMLESFGASDPLLTRTNLTPAEVIELNAKRQFDELRALVEMSMGVFLG